MSIVLAQILGEAEMVQEGQEAPQRGICDGLSLSLITARPAAVMNGYARI